MTELGTRRACWERRARARCMTPKTGWRRRSSRTLSVIQYSYDGDGKRVMKVICLSGTSSCTPSVAGAVTTVYVYNAQGQLAEEAGPSTDTGTKYIFADGLGSTRLETDANGGSVRCMDYAPFGLELPAAMGGRGSCYATQSYPSGTPDSLDVKFSGKERDAETGLDFFESRYYSSAQDRFTSPDEFKGGFLDAFTGQSAFQPGPLPYADIGDPQTLNKYAYVRNNPLRYTDPDGHCIDACVGEAILAYTAATAVAGGVIYYAQKLGTAIGNYFAAKRADNTSESSKTSPDTKNPASVSPLPANPGDLVDQGYHDVSHPEAAAAGHQTSEHPETGDRVRFDKGQAWSARPRRYRPLS